MATPQPHLPPSSSSSSRRPPSHTQAYIGDYKRLESIGQGSFAIVYRCVHPAGSLVAIKSVHHTKLKGKLKANLFSEIEILKSVKHPHIVALIDILESANHVHLVMELGWLGDLAMFMKKRDKLDTQPMTAEMVRRYPNPPGAGVNEVVARHFSKQLASALEYLRAKNLVHRDLKPQNLLLSPSPLFLARMKPEEKPYEPAKNSLVPVAGVQSMPILKIADFGFARVLEKTSLAETLCGSPLYMAPEILRYEKYDAKADLWSVGAILYELMAGKPPFRAQNHVDLLRKIEKSPDKVAFPREVVDISDDMKKIIRALMKKTPTERISWEDYFHCAINTEEIPGLVEADRPRHASVGSTDSEVEPDRRSDRAFGKSRAPATAVPASIHAADDAVRRDLNEPRSYDRAGLAVETRPSSSLPPRGSNEPLTNAQHESNQSHGKTPSSPRPQLRTHDTAPPVPTAATDRNSMATAVAAAVQMERRRSHQMANPNSPTLKDPTDRSNARREERMARDVREKAAQDVAFERDYVMVEKRAVEVNAFADELNVSPQVQRGHRDQLQQPSSQGAMVRRGTTSSLPLSAAGTPTAPTTTDLVRQSPSPSSPRTDSHQRRPSYERRYGPNPKSVTSIIGKALNSANVRIWGTSFSPPLGRGPSPPQGYNAFPAYPVPNQGYSPTADLPSKALSAMDEDTRTYFVLEEVATRSDVVYGFAKVKYKQLVPISPSNGNNLGAIGRAASPSDAPSDDAALEDDLTPDAVVAISEEALVLYVKGLALLSKTLDIAGAWWERRKRYPSATSVTATAIETSSLPSRPSTSGGSGSSGGSGGNSTGARDHFPVAVRINGIVQWSRNRFNECLEKSEFVARKLEDAQRKLPLSHDAHPSNHPEPFSSASGGSYSSNKVMGAATTYYIHLSSGVTAEKLMYDRALEMSCTAAVNELMGEDLPGCDVSYATAMRLLEAVLERDDVSPGPARRSGSSQGSGGGGALASGRNKALVAAQDKSTSANVNPVATEAESTIDGIEEADRSAVTQIIESMRNRRIALNRKLAAQAAQQDAGAPSGLESPGNGSTPRRNSFRVMPGSASPGR